MTTPTVRVTVRKDTETLMTTVSRDIDGEYYELSEHGLRYPADAYELASMLHDPEFRARAVRAGYVAGTVVIVSDLVRHMRQLEAK
jgi:hypothetical protein